MAKPKAGSEERFDAKAVKAALFELERRVVALETARGIRADGTGVPVSTTISTGEAAQILGLSKSRIARLAAAERLGTKPNGTWRLVRDRVLALKRRREP